MLEPLKRAVRPYLPRNISETLRKQRERGWNHIRVIGQEPLVILACWGRPMNSLFSNLNGIPTRVGFIFIWAYDQPEDWDLIQRQFTAMVRPYPQVSGFFLCNTPEQREGLRARGLDAIFCSHNALVSEAVFKPALQPHPEYDAIYDAGIVPFKRHMLTQKISSLALIYHHYAGTDIPEYTRSMKEQLRHAAWLNDRLGPGHLKLSPDQVCTVYQRCRVGLCLSAMEGAMFASIQYLLCGLPIVTTASRGGRDQFFDPHHVLEVEATPQAVAAGVQEMIQRNLSPKLIREKTLAKIRSHRERLQQHIAEHVPDLNFPWPPGTLGPVQWQYLPETAKTLRNTRGVRNTAMGAVPEPEQQV